MLLYLYRINNQTTKDIIAMLHTVHASQESIIGHDNDKIVRSFLGSLHSGSGENLTEVAISVVDIVGADKFASFSFVREDRNTNLGFNLAGLDTEEQRLRFYSQNKKAINGLLDDIFTENNTNLEQFIEDQQEYFNDGEQLPFSYPELATAFKDEDVNYMCYESLVSSVVCGVVDCIAKYFLGFCGSLLQKERSSNTDNKDCLNTPKGMAYAYLSYEPSNPKARLAHALIDNSGHNAFVADARLLDKLDTFTGDNLTNLPTRYSRVEFFVKHAKKVADWIEAEMEADPFHMGFHNWVYRIKDNVPADIFDALSDDDMTNIILKARYNHHYFDEIINAVMLYVIATVSRDFAYFCKANGNTFNANSEAVDEAVKSAIYSEAYKQAKADILKSLQAA